MNNKIVRSICYFTDKPDTGIIEKVDSVAKTLEQKGYLIQTKRICSPNATIKETDRIFDDDFLLSVGTLSRTKAEKQLVDFFSAKNVFFNIDLSDASISKSDAEILFRIIKEHPEKTFNFTYVFNNVHSSPFFPSASYNRNGFSIGLQPTDLSENCRSLDEWLNKTRLVWKEIAKMFKDDKEFMGIDSSVAPILEGKGSFVSFIKSLGFQFSHSVTTDIYLKISQFIKESNPKPAGLCGLMFPCLEDFELAEEYEKGNFSIERNVYLSLHSGLGIDTYPIGTDEDPKRVAEILSLLKCLSKKYSKPLSARFVSDGKTKIGRKTRFQNQYLKDVVVRKL